jgi:thiosulfate reductase cytochrome b subunit
MSLGAAMRASSRHPVWIRCAHWVAALCVLVLAVTGFVILMAHPRLYWGEVGNALTPALIELPISRNYRHGGYTAPTPIAGDLDRASATSGAGTSSPVSANRTYDIFNKNGWGRSLHFLAAWILVAAGSVYLLAGFVTGHVRRDLVPRAAELALRPVLQELRDHLRLQIRPGTGGPQYGLLQKCAYLTVVGPALPLMALTGLAMSPAVSASYPLVAGMFGGSQSARTIHFFVFVALLLFLAGHVLMVALSGFRRHMRAMTVGE